MSARSVEGGSDQGPAGAGTAGRRRLFSARLMVLLVLLAYSGLSVYSGSFLPLRLVNGESMEPALSSGDIVLLKGTRFSEIDIGDIIAYKVPEAAEGASGPTTILHRVQKTAARNGQRVLITKGDNSSTDPWPVTASQVEGKQALRIPALGKPVVMLTSPRGILFVSIAILISLLYIPAMVMFHTTVLRKPPSQQENALEGPREEPLVQPGPGATIIDAVV
ncbi:MAG: signal peptidase I, partial [Chloroflexi bacterium]|nr:signal peptidase I [Chloroflexota bacterium]